MIYGNWMLDRPRCVAYKLEPRLDQRRLYYHCHANKGHTGPHVASRNGEPVYWGRGLT